MKLLMMIVLALLLTGCSQQTDIPARETEPGQPVQPVQTLQTEPAEPDSIDRLMQSMTTEEKVGQLFLARCNGETALEDIRKYHFGGFLLFGVDFKDRTPDELFNTIASYQFTARLPMLIAVVMLVIAFFHPIEKEMAAMRRKS